MGFKEAMTKTMAGLREARARKKAQVAVRTKELHRVRTIKAAIKAEEQEEYLKAQFSHAKRIGQARAKRDADVEIERLKQSAKSSGSTGSSSKGFMQGFEMPQPQQHDTSFDMFAPQTTSTKKKKQDGLGWQS